MKLTSPAFPEGGHIPPQHTCDGADVSPAFEWSGAPEATKSFALVCDDPDAPAGDWVHWTVYDLPPDSTGLPEGVPPSDDVPGGGRQGRNDFRRIGYGGPCPPGGTHRYVFALYALDRMLRLRGGAAKGEVRAAIRGHVLAEGRLTGKYSRR